MTFAPEPENRGHARDERGWYALCANAIHLSGGGSDEAFVSAGQLPNQQVKDVLYMRPIGGHVADFCVYWMIFTRPGERSGLLHDDGLPLLNNKWGSFRHY
jgi:hypothetical protein